MTDEERALAERNVRSLTALLTQMGGDVTAFIRHVAESMAMSTAMLREKDRVIREIAAELRAHRAREAKGE